jgi:hypothetical protein
MRTAMCLVAAIVSSSAAFQTAREDFSTKAVVARAASYVAEYQQKLTSVVADEDYAQAVLAQVPADPEMPRTRRLRSEVFFIFEPVGRQWMAIRDPILVDGLPVQDRPNVRQAFETMAPSEIRRHYADLNARWNVGRITRNFNEPTLGLLVLDAEHRERFRFDRRSVIRDGATTLVTLEFREQDRPTLIRDATIGQVFSRGEIVTDAAGVIRRTVFRLALNQLKVELVTDYRVDAKLGIWVPVLFTERYERGRPGSTRHDQITCEATYSNYRRFDVVTRIK